MQYPFFRVGQLCLLLALALATLHCGEASDKQRILAEYEGGYLTETELIAFLGTLPEVVRKPQAGMDSTSWLKRMTRESILQKTATTPDELLFRQTSADYQRDRAFDVDAALAQAFVAMEMPDPDLSDDSIRSFLLESAPQEFRERREVYNIFLAFPPNANDGQREVVYQRLQSIRAEITSPEAFQNAARQHSNSSTAANGGLIGIASRGDLGKELAEKIFALETGGMTDVLKTRSGCHLFFVTRIVPPEISEEMLSLAKERFVQFSANRWRKEQRERLLSQWNLPMPVWPTTSPASFIFRLGDRSITRDDVTKAAAGGAQGPAFWRLVDNALLATVMRQQYAAEAASIDNAVTRRVAYEHAQLAAARKNLNNLPDAVFQNAYQANLNKYRLQATVSFTMAALPPSVPATITNSRLEQLRAGAIAAPGNEFRAYGPINIGTLTQQNTPLSRAIQANLKPGEVLGPIENGESLAVVRIDKVTRNRMQSYLEARDQVREDYYGNHAVQWMNAWKEEMLKQLGISLDEGAITKLAEQKPWEGISVSAQ